MRSTRTPKRERHWFVGQASSLPGSVAAWEKISGIFATTGRLEACPTTFGTRRLRSSGSNKQKFSIELRRRLNELARRTLKPEDFQPPLRLDAEVSLKEITLNSLAELEKLKPMGQENSAVPFCARQVTQSRPAQRRSPLNLSVSDPPSADDVQAGADQVDELIAALKR